MGVPTSNNNPCQPCKDCDCNLLETMGLSCQEVAENTLYGLSFDKDCKPSLINLQPPSVPDRMTFRVRITPNRLPPAPTWFLPGNFGATLGSLDAGNRFTLQVFDIVTQGTAGYYTTPSAGQLTYGTSLHQLFTLDDFHSSPNTAYKISVLAMNKPTFYTGSNSDDVPANSTFQTSELFPVLSGRAANKAHFGLTFQNGGGIFLPFSQAQMLAAPLDSFVPQAYYGAFFTFFLSQTQYLVCGNDTVAAATTVPTVNYLDFLITIEG